MQRAQSEIDAVVGRDRLPRSSDAEHMPYVVAIVREVLRWKPIIPLGMVICLVLVINLHVNVHDHRRLT